MACDNFKEKWKDNLYVKDEFLSITRERPFKTVMDLIIYILDEDNIRLIKVGKNIVNCICNQYILLEIDEFLDNLDLFFDYDPSSKNKEEIKFDYLNSLDDLLYPGQYVKR